MKKKLAAILTSIFIVGLLSITALAYSSSAGSAPAVASTESYAAPYKANYGYCYSNYCYATGIHKHNGKTYSANRAGNGYGNYNRGGGYCCR